MIIRLTYNPDITDCLKSLYRTTDKVFLMLLDDIHANVVHKIEGCTKRNSSGIIWSSRLKLKRWLCECRPRERHFVNHLASTHPRVHSVKKFATAIESARAKGCVDLMSREREEVAANGLNINSFMGNALGCVNDGYCSNRMSQLAHLANVIDRAHDIGHMSYAYNFSALA